MAAAEAWTIATIGFCLGLVGREALAGWVDIARTLLKPAPAAAPVAAPISDTEFTTVHAWAQMNPWYTADNALNMEAQIIHMGLRSREPHLTLERNLAEVTAEMHRRHPEIVPTRQ